MKDLGGHLGHAPRPVIQGSKEETSGKPVMFEIKLVKAGGYLHTVMSELKYIKYKIILSFTGYLLK